MMTASGIVLLCVVGVIFVLLLGVALHAWERTVELEDRLDAVERRSGRVSVCDQPEAWWSEQVRH